MKKQFTRKHPFKPHAYRAISLEQLMGLTRPPGKVPLYRYVGTKGEIEVMSRGLTMVLSREVNANVRIAADIAISVAQKNPERPVWYVNTFAGIELMQQAMDEARRNNGVAEIVPDPVLDDDGDNHPLSPALKRRGDLVLPNLHFFEIPIGQWDVEAMSAALRGDPHPTSPAAAGEENKVRGESPIVIVNSFDYSPLSRGGKWRMARELLEVMEAFDMSLVVFTQDMRLEFEAGVAGRGSVGLMCGRAERVARLTDPFEHLIRSRKPRNSPETDTVHEAQMHVPDDAPARTIIVKNERGETEVEIFGRDKWKLARELGKILKD